MLSGSLGLEPRHVRRLAAPSVRTLLVLVPSCLSVESWTKQFARGVATRAGLFSRVRIRVDRLAREVTRVEKLEILLATI